jgi:hypothetical protein
MQQLPVIRILAAFALVLVALAGCSVDPMERLTEDIKSQDKSIRERAVLTLANLEDERAVDSLVDVLEGDDELCDMAGVALVKKGREVKEPDPKKPNPVVDQVGKVLNNTHLAEPFRGRAAWVLGAKSATAAPSRRCRLPRPGPRSARSRPWWCARWPSRASRSWAISRPSGPSTSPWASCRAHVRTCLTPRPWLRCRRTRFA